MDVWLHRRMSLLLSRLAHSNGRPVNARRRKVPLQHDTPPTLALSAPVRLSTPVWRRDREADGTRLLNERAPKGHRGFESLRLRQFFMSHAPKALRQGGA
jgi:hypothetical protein